MRLPSWKKPSRAMLGLLGDVDLALVEALEELVDREVDEANVVRSFEDGVGHGLAHDDAG